MNHTVRKLFHLVLALCAAVSLVTTAALADTSYSITMNCSYGGSSVSGATFRLYRVMEKKSDGSYALTSDFNASGVNVMSSTTDWAMAANSLAVYARGSSSSLMLSSATTNSSGACTFTPAEAGVYLILGDTLSVGYGTYTFSPSLVTLPDASGNMTLTANAKVSYSSYSPPGNDPISVTALKVWNGDEGQEAVRPAYVTVALVHDNTTYQTVQLSDSNNWRYSWNNLNPNYSWSVVEVSVPDNYTVEYTQSANIQTITNSYTPNIPPEEPPTTDIPPELPPTTNLPQTGLLQWPIPVMAVLGLVLFSLGWWECFGRRNHEE